MTSRLPTRVTVDTRTTLREALDSPGGGRRSLLCRMTVRSFAPNAPRKAPVDALRDPGKGHFAIERRKNGAADEGRAAQTGQDSAAKPLYGDTAAIDHRSLGAVDGKWRLVTEIDDPGLASIAAPA